MTKIYWRGIALDWHDGTTPPQFSNGNYQHTGTDRCCACSVKPRGTAWAAELMVNGMKGLGGGDTPQEALDNALQSMKDAIQRFEDATHPNANAVAAS
jgi:hypothetical protein